SVESFKCDICQFSKHHRATFSPSNNKSLEPFDLIHSDVWGPASNSILGAKWFVAFIDDCTYLTWIFLMKHKYEVCQIFVNFFCLVKNQFNKSIKRLWSDNGIEFLNLEFSKFLKDNGVVHELTCVNTLQQNGVAERKNHHLLEVVRALLFQMSIPNVYWGETVLTATYLINKLSTQVLNSISPIKHMFSFFPSSPLMLSLPSRVFGCVAFVHSHHPHRGKLDLRAVKCVFISYSSNKKGFKCYHSLSRRFFVSMYSFFVCPPPQRESYLEVDIPDNSIEEQVQLSEPKVSIPDNFIEDVTDDIPFALRKGKRSCVKYPISQFMCTEPEVSIPDNSIEDVTDDMPIALRKGKQSCVYYPISQFVCTDHLSVQHQSFIVVIDAIQTPTSIQEALKDENWV
ncbi:hypothetical protein CR513_48974, partial [Mucuna pruriens]